MNRVPAQLSYLVVFNPTLSPPSSSHVDEDDIEQSHILFYTSRARAVSRDTMLRQVGLAKALINFSEMFTAEAGCDNVHSQSKRMIMVSPEPNYWIHVSIDVARTPKPPPKTSKGKGKDPPSSSASPAPPEELFDYHENKTHDVVLKSQVIRAYEEFKLLHGTFDEILTKFGNSALEHLLEQFFSVWTWNWDLASIPDPSLLFGVPLHSHHDRIRPMTKNLYAELPTTVIPLALSLNPRSILTSPAESGLFPPSLPSRLLSIIPPPRPLLTSTSSSATLRPPKSISSTSSPSDQPETITDPSTSLPPSSSGFFHTATTLTNPKKWTWPGYLTIGKSSDSAANSRSGTPNTSADEKPSSNPPPSPPTDETTPNAPELSSNPSPSPKLDRPTILSPQPVEMHRVDQQALEDAIGNLSDSASPSDSSPSTSTSATSASTSAHDDDGQNVKGFAPWTSKIFRKVMPSVRDDGEEVVEVEKVEPVTTEPTVESDPVPVPAPTVDDSAVETLTDPVTLDVVAVEEQVAAPSTANETIDHVSVGEEEEPESIYESYPPLPPSPPPPPPFTKFTIHTSLAERLGETSKRRVLYISNYGLALALVTSISGLEGETDDTEDTEPDWAMGLEETVDDILKKLRDAVDSADKQAADVTATLDVSSIAATSTTAITLYTQTGTTTTTPKSVFGTVRSSHIVGAKETFNRHPIGLVESITRTTSNQWYASRRATFAPKNKSKFDGSNSTERQQGIEVYLEVGNTQASLVDVDTELGTAVRSAFS